jgi:uncharacterized membrane protein
VHTFIIFLIIFPTNIYTKQHLWIYSSHINANFSVIGSFKPNMRLILQVIMILSINLDLKLKFLDISVHTSIIFLIIFPTNVYTKQHLWIYSSHINANFSVIGSSKPNIRLILQVIMILSVNLDLKLKAMINKCCKP